MDLATRYCHLLEGTSVAKAGGPDLFYTARLKRCPSPTLAASKLPRTPAANPGYHLLHLQHGVHHSLRFGDIFFLQELTQGIGNDLPRYSEFILEPPTTFFRSPNRKFFPIVIDFLLRFALHKERYGRREFESGTAVQSHKFLSVQFKGDRHHGSFWNRTSISPAGHVHDPRVLEDREIKINCFLGVVIEPKKWGDLLHCIIPFTQWRRGMSARTRSSRR